MEKNFQELNSLAKYKEILKIQPINIIALTKCSELCSRIGARNKSQKNKMRDYFAAAKTYAELALRVAPQNSEANFVMSMVMGRLAMTGTTKEKIRAVKDIKKYADLSLKYNPNNFKAWHVVGKWYFELSNLNGFERTAAKIFYGGIPKGTYGDAIIAYEKARSLEPTFLLNYLELAKAYRKNKEESKAIPLLKTMMTFPNKTEDDERIRSEGRNLLESLK
ncbi:MAG: hypothetical protein ABIQ56_01555 [Chitinophagaceae bacterium]